MNHEFRSRSAAAIRGAALGRPVTASPFPHVSVLDDMWAGDAVHYFRVGAEAAELYVLIAP